jgi:hypothetical protein
MQFGVKPLFKREVGVGLSQRGRESDAFVTSL